MVVLDPTRAVHPAFERGLQAAQMTGASLHLFTCTCKPPRLLEGETPTQGLARFRDEVRASMRALTSRAAALGVSAETEIACAHDFRQEMVQAAARCRADIVIKHSEERPIAQREQRETADWMLMRLAPCPVLMVKNQSDWAHRRILAAVNLDSHDLAHIRLNNCIISEMQRFVDEFGAEAHVVMAYSDLNRVPDRSEVARTCGVEASRVFLGHGGASMVIGNTAMRIGADLVLIGTVARSGLMGTVLGNTAERVLDESRADVLVLN